VLAQFLIACLVLAALPGPATVLCLHRTLRDGRAAGLAAVAGNEVGVFGWALCGGGGVSVLLTANRALFDALHVVGCVTLVALGVQAWRGGTRKSGRARGRTPRAAFRTSLLSIAGNPKAAVFAISFLPRFLQPGHVRPAALVTLASLQVLVDSAWTGGLVLTADRARSLFSSCAVRAPLERALGAVLIALGVELAVDR
jgi:threonine/homoserine/homoserine lactone efflux protein